MRIVSVVVLVAAASAVAAPPPRDDIDEVVDPPNEEPDWSTESFRRRGATSQRSKRSSHARFTSASDSDRSLACEMLIAVDEPLYAHLGRRMENVTELVGDMMGRLNYIYHRTFLRPPDFGDIYFHAKEVRVLFDFCTECNHTQQVFLTEFSKMDFSDFCLAHVFTYRDFPAGIQGLAWRSTICHRTYNTGFTTLLNHGIPASRAESAMTFAHEVGHNLGADHDEDSRPAPCPSGFIMSTSGSSQAQPNFSECSIREMTSEVKKKLQNSRLHDCFTELEESEAEKFSVCGDGVVEGGEECDCGLSYKTCGDPCCYAAHIDPAHLAANKSATPCRMSSTYVCLHPWQSLWTYGFVVPWVFIAVVAILSAIALVYDWHHDRKAYTHITDPADMIRSETAEQMSRRLSRQREEGKQVFVIQKSPPPSIVRPSAPPPPVPEQPKAGIVAQMKNQITKS